MNYQTYIRYSIFEFWKQIILYHKNERAPSQLWIDYFKQHEAAVIAGSEMICGQCDICHRSINMSGTPESPALSAHAPLYCNKIITHLFFFLYVIYRFLSNFTRLGYLLIHIKHTDQRDAFRASSQMRRLRCPYPGQVGPSLLALFAQAESRKCI